MNNEKLENDININKIESKVDTINNLSMANIKMANEHDIDLDIIKGIPENNNYTSNNTNILQVISTYKF